ncbi:MAG: hypothetical protein R3C56_00710 [Pirellulaceae bacterium]
MWPDAPPSVLLPASSSELPEHKHRAPLPLDAFHPGELHMTPLIGRRFFLGSIAAGLGTAAGWQAVAALEMNCSRE